MKALAVLVLLLLAGCASPGQEPAEIVRHQVRIGIDVDGEQPDTNYTLRIPFPTGGELSTTDWNETLRIAMIGRATWFVDGDYIVVESDADVQLEAERGALQRDIEGLTWAGNPDEVIVISQSNAPLRMSLNFNAIGDVCYREANFFSPSAFQSGTVTLSGSDQFRCY